MIQIPLTRGKFAVIDDTDFPLVRVYKWWAQEGRNTWYAVAFVDGVQQTMHKVLFGSPKTRVDHRNCDGLDNRRTNLRLATNSQNVANCRRYANNTSGVKGVSWKKSHQKWCARIRGNFIDRHLGYFTRLEDAAAAYAQAAHRYFGEFARAA